MASPTTGTADQRSLEHVPPLTVLIGAVAAHVIKPGDAPVVIGRETPAGDAPGANGTSAPGANETSAPGQKPADILVHDHRISRRHLVLDVRDGRWMATDPGSRNGTFIKGDRVSEFVIPHDKELVAHLGHPSVGIAVTFSTADPGIVYAGMQVAARRKELGFSQRGLAAGGVMNAGALIAFEKGRSWPQVGTQEKLENVLRWPRGEISRLRRQVANGGVTTAVTEIDPEKTAVVPPSPSPAREETGSTAVDPGFLAQWASQNLAKARAHRAELPPVTNRNYQSAVSRLIDELSSLELLVHNASGAPELRSVFLQVRAELREVMLEAAAAPSATVGQRLFAARDRDRLSVDDAALMAGVPAASLRAFEAGGHLPDEDKALLEDFLASLQ
ncbi:FHA domain-containing protein [Mycolicibacterium sp. CBMA 226]|uniref:FHA domain-containing protein n=1 Tax=Mycolicibacterium sp. CBMA 226 TaxID=2606611 RepID=UPI001412025D|nr:FHA domain-containing protein [Mycolicibacterium sp. CBMA 226]